MCRAIRFALILGGFAVALLAGPSTSALAGQRAYVSDYHGQQLFGYSVAGSGALKPLGVPLPEYDEPGTEGITLSPDGKRLFTASGGADLRGFKVNRNGTLTELDGSPAINGYAPYGVAVTPNGKFVYVATGSPQGPGAYRLSGSSMTPVPGAIWPTGHAPAGLAISPDGKFMFSADSSEGVRVYRLAADGGFSEIAGSPFLGGGAGAIPFAISITPDGKGLYVSSRDAAPEVYAFRIASNGSLTEIDDSPYPLTGAGNPFGSTVDPVGKFLFVTDYDGGIYTLRIRPDKGLVLASGSPVAFPGGSSTPAFNAYGDRLYVTGSGGDLARGYSLNADGIPSEIGSSPFDAAIGDFQSIALTPGQPPKAKFKAKAAGKKRKVSFDAKKTKDPDSGIAYYAWNFGDGKSKLAGPRVKHKYKRPGKYKVRVTVFDNTGCSTDYVSAGQTAYCNGSKKAVAKKTVTVKRKR